ncbi:MAG: hypothetical protein K2Y08_01205 [Alphaproteobacteria bacterium]|nr:hypothetical protein [Alphaproteobacteria bacterium]
MRLEREKKAIETLRDSFLQDGACLISDKYLFLAADQWKTISYKASRLTYEKHFHTKTAPHSFKASPIKKHRTKTIADEVIFDVVNSIQMRSLVKSILSFSHFNVQRCECHIYEEGDFISLEWMKKFIKDASHLLTITLESDYEGGEHLIHHNKQERKIFQPQSAEILISSCNFDHEMMPLISGQKNTVLASLRPLYSESFTK